MQWNTQTEDIVAGCAVSSHWMTTLACRFAVTPLTEDCGILEWVPKTGTLRSAVQGIYQQEGHFDPRRTNSVIDAMYKQHEHKYQVGMAASGVACLLVILPCCWLKVVTTCMNVVRNLASAPQWSHAPALLDGHLCLAGC